MFTLHHFGSSTRSVVKLGLTVCTLILTVKDSSCGQRLEKGKSFFSLSLCRAKVHRFTLTASTRLHNSKHVKNEKTGKKKVKDRWGKKGAGWCHPFNSNKEDPVSRENTKTLHFFSLRCQNDEQQLQKQRWWKEEGNQTNEESAVATKNQKNRTKGLAARQVSKKSILVIQFITWEVSFQSRIRTIQCHLAACEEVFFLSQIQRGNLTAQTVHFWHIMTHSCFHIWQNKQEEAEQTPPCLLAARRFQK